MTSSSSAADLRALPAPFASSNSSPNSRCACWKKAPRSARTRSPAPSWNAVRSMRCCRTGAPRRPRSACRRNTTNLRSSHAPGADVRAKITMLAEGCRGSLSKQVINQFKLDEGHCPQTYGLGLKELWQLAKGRGQPGRIEHTIGWPLDNRTYGGSFIYHLSDDRAYVGFVAGLDYEDPRFKPFEAFQQFKNHPSVKPLLEGGEIISGGARTIAAGGWQSLPTLEMPGALLIGDAGGNVNVPKIKGIHQAIRSGTLAAEHFVEARARTRFDARWRASPGGCELKKVRNIKPGFKRGLWFGLANAALETVTAGKLPWTLKNSASYAATVKLGEYESPDRGWTDRTL